MTIIVASVLAGLGVAALAWRAASRRRRLPCPHWLGWLVESPYMSAVAGESTILDRAGVDTGMRVLDAGCGPGRITIPAAERVGRTGEVVAVDVQEAMVNRVRHRAAARGISNIRLLCVPLEAAGLEWEAFDRALLVTVLGEIPDRAAAMRALYAALKPNGLLSVSEVIPDPHYQSRHVVRKLAEAAGFRFERLHGSAFAFTMNLRKSA